MNVPLQHLPRLLLNEAVLRRHWLVVGFVVVNIAAVGLGLVWPKIYTASATIYVEERNIIQPLMQGTAVATTAVDRARIAREVIFSRRTLERVLQDVDLPAETADVEAEQDAPSRSGSAPAQRAGALARERAMDAIKERTRVLNVGNGLVKVEYQDENAKRAQQITQRFADLFVQESTVTQSRESADAFEFIDGQVKAYHEKLTQAEQALKEFRSEHLDARPGTEGQITTRISELQAAIERTTLALNEAQIKQSSLEKQLAGEAVVATSLSRESQYVGRIAELQTQLDTLRLSYHDTYPDIVRLKHQINELRELTEAERTKREEMKSAIVSGNVDAVDQSFRVSPIYQRLRTELLDTNTNIETLRSRVEQTRALLKAEQARAEKLYGGEAILAELTRDYEVNRDIYHDLLKRRENARVSKNLDANQQGLTMRIYEPAVVPLEPTGLRFLDFAAAGLLSGLVLPLGILVMFQQVDPRVRVPTVITERLGVPVLAAISRTVLTSEVAKLDRSLSRLSIMVFATLVFVIAIGMLKYVGRL